MELDDDDSFSQDREQDHVAKQQLFVVPNSKTKLRACLKCFNKIIFKFFWDALIIHRSLQIYHFWQMLNNKCETISKSQSIMNDRNMLLSFISIILIFVSLFFLFRMTVNPSQHLHETSSPRFYCFIAQHLVGLVMFIRLLQVRFTYQYVVWGFQITAINSFAMTATELSIYLKFHSSRMDDTYKQAPLQLGFLNCYFLIYLYSLIALLLSSLYIIFTKAVAHMRDRRIRRAIEQFIEDVPYQLSMAELDCPICLTSFSDQEKTGRIFCRHTFHRDCIQEWIKINTNCPVCRSNVFQRDGGDNPDIQII